MKSEFYQVEILSPIHIGSGDSVDPFHYVINTEANPPLCHFVDPSGWAADHPDPEELVRIFSGSNIAAIRGYLAEHIDIDSYAERSCQVVSTKVLKDYHQNLDKPESKNQLLLSPNLIGGGGGPLLPGSSLKGAIRTVVIDWLDREHRLHLKDCNKLKDQDDKLKPFFGSITDNSFQALKIADCEAACDSSLIVESREIRRNPEKDPTPKVNCEVLASRLLGDQHQAILATRIALGRPRESQPVLTLKNGKSFYWQQLCELVNAYSRTRYQDESRKFWHLPQFAKTKAAMAKIEDVILSPPAETMVFRVGHYSQIEYVTVAQNKPLTRKTKDGGIMPHGTTRTLADGQYPFGWVMLSPCTESEYRQILDARDELNRQRRQQQNQQREQRRVVVAQQREAAQQRRQAEALLRQQQEEQRREEAAKPWLAWIRSLEKLDNWGELKQWLDKPEHSTHRDQPALAQAVLQAAMRVYQTRPDKWEADRQELVNQWLAETGLQMQTEAPAEIRDADCDLIDTLRDYGDYRQRNIDPAQLSRAALQLLVEKMKAWGCDNRKAKKDKIAAYEQVVKSFKNKGSQS